MSFIQLNDMNEVQELKLAPEGEYALAITDQEFYTNDKGRDIVRCRIEFEDHDEFAGFTHWLALPSKKLDEDEEKYTRMMRNTKRFLTLWGVSMDNGFDPSDLQGARCIAGVGQRTNDETGDVYNELKVPRIK